MVFGNMIEIRGCFIEQGGVQVYTETTWRIGFWAGSKRRKSTKKRGQYRQIQLPFFSRFVGSFQSRQKADSSGSLCIPVPLQAHPKGLNWKLPRLNYFRMGCIKFNTTHSKIIQSRGFEPVYWPIFESREVYIWNGSQFFLSFLDRSLFPLSTKPTNS